MTTLGVCIPRPFQPFRSISRPSWRSGVCGFFFLLCLPESRSRSSCMPRSCFTISIASPAKLCVSSTSVIQVFLSSPLLFKMLLVPCETASQGSVGDTLLIFSHLCFPPLSVCLCVYAPRCAAQIKRLDQVCTTIPIECAYAVSIFCLPSFSSLAAIGWFCRSCRKLDAWCGSIEQKPRWTQKK